MRLCSHCQAVMHKPEAAAQRVVVVGGTKALELMREELAVARVERLTESNYLAWVRDRVQAAAEQRAAGVDAGKVLDRLVDGVNELLAQRNAVLGVEG